MLTQTTYSGREALALKLNSMGAVSLIDQPGSRFMRFNFRTLKHPTQPGPLSYDVAKAIGICLFEFACEDCAHCQAVVGVPWTGNAFASAFALCSGMEPLFLKKSWMETPEARWSISSLMHSASENIHNAVLVDDVALNPFSLNESITTLKNVGIRARSALAFVGPEPGTECLLDGCKLRAVFATPAELLKLYLDNKRVPGYLLERVTTYLDKHLVN